MTALPSGARTTGALPASTPLRLTIALQPQDPGALAAYATAVSTPGTAEYRHYLSRDEFATRFGATPAAISAVESVLRADGLTVGAVSANRLTIAASASAGTVERAFDVSLAAVRLASGAQGYANVEAPALPSTVATYVQGVIGLYNAAAPHPGAIPAHLQRRTAPSATASGAEHANAVGVGPGPCASATTAQQSYESQYQAYSYTADQVASAYGFESLYTAGDEGAGQTVALVEQEPFGAGDIQAYQSCYGTAAPISTTNVDGGAKAPANGDLTEADLDIEQVIGLAPKASIAVYDGPSTEQGGADIITAIVSDDKAKAISTSYSSCEPVTTSAVSSAENTALQEAAVQGQSFFAASGDQGSAGCAYLSGSLGVGFDKLAVNDPASQPFATGVGGTTMGNGSGNNFTTQTGGGYAPESVWNDGDSCSSTSRSPSCASATGGGTSQTWTMPSYQSGASSALDVMANASDACGPAGNQPCREVPDVAADGDPISGYLVYVTPASGVCPGGAGSCWIPVGGTSASAPLWAAFAALANGSTTCRGLTLGFLNPGLYNLADSVFASDFHDTTAASAISGYGNNDPFAGDPINNTQDSGYLYPVHAGYDMTTGLGSMQAASLAANLCSMRAPIYSVTVTNPGTVTAAQKVPFSLAIHAKDSGGATLHYAASGLPKGLTISASTGVISGTPLVSGTFAVAVGAADQYTNTGVAKFTLQVVKPGKPTVSHARLTGLTGRSPKLTVTVKAGSHEPGVRTIKIKLPHGLTFKAGNKLARGLQVRARHGLSYTALARGGTITIKLASSASPTSVTVKCSALSARANLKDDVRRHKTTRLRLRATITDATTGTSATRSVKLKV